MQKKNIKCVRDQRGQTWTIAAYAAVSAREAAVAAEIAADIAADATASAVDKKVVVRDASTIRFYARLASQCARAGRM